MTSTDSAFTGLPAALLAALVSLATVAPAAGQEATPAAELAASAKAPEAIPADQIPARASTARVTLDSIRSRLPEPGGSKADALQSLSAVIDQLRKQPDMSRLDRLPEFRIAELQRQVRFYQRELDKLQSRDVARATRLSADAAETSRLRELWSTTLAKAEQSRLSYPLIDESRSVLNRIDETERLLAKPLEDALARRERAGRYETRLETLARTLQDASDRAKTRRLSRDVEPIWSADALKISPQRDWASVQARIDDQVRFSRDYFSARRGILEMLGLVAVLAFAAVVWLRRKRDWIAAGGEQLLDASRVLKRPFSSMLLTLLVVALVLSELAPPIVLETLAVATMLLMLRLMPGRLVAGRFFLLVGLAVNYLVMRVFFPEPSSITVPYTFFKQQVKAGNVEDVTSVGDSIQGTFKSPVSYPAEAAQARGGQALPSSGAEQRKSQTSTEFETQRPVFADPGLEALLEEEGVVIRAMDERGSSWFNLLAAFGPTLLLIGAFVWLSRRARSRIDRRSSSVNWLNRSPRSTFTWLCDTKRS